MNWQSILIEEAQTQIKLLIKQAILLEIPTYAELRNKINKTIDETVKELESEDLKRIARTTLQTFAEKMYASSLVKLGVPINMLLIAVGYMKNGSNLQEVVNRYKAINKARVEERVDDMPQAQTIGQANQMYSKAYFEEVKPVLQDLINSDPMYDRNISLRNIAEMTVRYEKTMQSIDSLKAQGVNFVQSSRHANCSKRCEKWQGGYYTLDNTYQVVDGIHFQPLSNATDQYHTTKKGKVYKNGHITGFNCRHYLTPYKKGYEQPMVSAKVVEKEREIDSKMRAMERLIRKWKETALIYKGVDKDKYVRAKAKATNYNQKYIAYAKANKRAYYPSRTDVF